jgi:hypothetical protein
MITSRRDLALLALPALCRAGTSAPDFKIGIYDTRAIAVAYAASKFNPVGGKMKEMQAAKAAGDEAKIKELEAWGQAHQRQLHRQGFGRVPVDDLLAHVKERLPEVASRAGVQAITMQCDWIAAAAEPVDLTDALVALFDPSPRTLKMVQDMKGKAPLALDVIEKHEH